MKFSQLVIASAAIAAGVEGFSTSKLSVVRQVSKSSIVYWKLFVIAYWNKKREQWGEIWDNLLCGTYSSRRLESAQDMCNISALQYTMDNEIYIICIRHKSSYLTYILSLFL